MHIRLPFLGELTLSRTRPVPPGSFAADGLHVVGRNLGALADTRFTAAYAAGMDSGHKIGRPRGSRADIHIEWRVYTCCWAAAHAQKLDGDFVECGVNTGILSLAVCKYVNFNEIGKRFYLFDTFEGIPVEQMSPAERKVRTAENEQLYEECYETARRNFARYPNARLIRGRVPDSLQTVTIDRVSYLSIDMNIVAPELAAIEYFWDRLVPGALVVLDDYGFIGYSQQYAAMNAFALRMGVEIYTCPTGQGLLIRPPAP